MIQFFTNIFDVLNRQHNHIIILAVYLCAVAVVIFLRVAAWLRYSAGAAAIEREDNIKSRSDVKKISNKLLRHAAAAYKRVADTAVTTVPTANIIERQVDKLHIAGWRYGSVVQFVEGFEAGLLWVGVILALVFNDVAHVYGVTAVAVFVLMRVIAAFFDFRAARTRLCDEMLIFIEREVGRFYASDAGGAVLRLKEELSFSQAKQTEAMTAALTQLTKTLHDNADNLNKTIAATTNGIHIEIANAIDEKLIRMTDDFAAAAESWQKSLTEAARVQTTINNSTTALEKAGAKLQTAAELLGTHLQGHSGALSEQLVALVRAVESVKTAQIAITQQSEYIEQNQKTLEAALHAYEASLQGVAQTLGDSLGAFVSVHAQSSAQAVNDALRGNIEKIMQLIRGA